MPDERTPRLPPGLDALWGGRKRTNRGPKAGLSADAIVAAAIRIADADGFPAVSMSRVAAELGYTTMSLYRHVANKDELLQMMWDASAHGVGDLVLAGETWRERLRAWAIAQRDALDLHPWILHLPIAAPPMAPNSLTFVERGLQTMDDTPLADVDKLRVIGLLSSYTLNEARMAHDAAEAARSAAAVAGTDDGPSAASFEAILRLLVTEDRFPRLHRIAWADELGDEPSGLPEREEFLWGVDRILDAVQVLIGRA